MMEHFCEKLFLLKPYILEVGRALVMPLSLNAYWEPSRTLKIDFFQKKLMTKSRKLFSQKALF